MVTALETGMSHLPAVEIPPVEEKIWGVTRCTFQSETTLIFHASIKAGGFCSKHHHEGRYNDFYVVHGALLVLFYKSAEDTLPKIRLVESGQRIVAPPHRWHRFYALTPVELIETYWSVCGIHDIVRYDEGGMADLPPNYDYTKDDIPPIPRPLPPPTLPDTDACCMTAPVIPERLPSLRLRRDSA
jgi:mannose-6-phosphate isomerase-like protein (cupin superfamily)